MLKKSDKSIFAPYTETHFQAIWPLVWAYLTVWETKSMSDFHCSLSLCDVVSLSQLVTYCHHSHKKLYRLAEMEDLEGFGVIWHMCSFMSGSQCGAPLGWGNDPDAKLLALVTQWDTCPAAPVQPPAKSTYIQTIISVCTEKLCHNTLLHCFCFCSLHCCSVLAFILVMRFCIAYPLSKYCYTEVKQFNYLLIANLKHLLCHV